MFRFRIVKPEGHKVSKGSSESPGIKPMSDEEAKREIEKAGGYQAYRKSVLQEQVPQRDINVMGDYYDAIAKAQGLSLEEFFAQHPLEYKHYREIVLAG